MLTDAVLQVVLALVSFLFLPVSLLLGPIVEPVAGFFDSAVTYIQTFLSWASVFVNPTILKAFILYVPAMWGFVASAHIAKWVIGLIRG
mgnify:CR=1 FL=1